MSLVSPLLGSDYSVDCSASTCYCLLSCEGGLSATLPARDGLAAVAFPRIPIPPFFSPSISPPRRLRRLNGVAQRLGTSRRLPGNKFDLSQCAVLDTGWPTANRQDSAAMSLCGAARLYSPLDVYRARIKTRMHVRRHASRARALPGSQISQSAGLSWAGCSKGKCGPKKYWLWGCHGNSLPRGVGCLLNCALGC